MKRMSFRPACLVLAVLALALWAPFAAAEEPSDPACAAAPVASLLGAQSDASYAFEGCWTFWAAGPCFDIYLDSSGGYWQCRLCGTTTNPGPAQCSRISIQTLNTGYWCS